MDKADATVARVRTMNYDQLIAAAGLVAPVARSTYLYVDADGEITSVEIRGDVRRDARPADEYFSIGFASQLRGN